MKSFAASPLFARASCLAFCLAGAVLLFSEAESTAEIEASRPKFQPGVLKLLFAPGTDQKKADDFLAVYGVLPCEEGYKEEILDVLRRQDDDLRVVRQSAPGARTVWRTVLVPYGQEQYWISIFLKGSVVKKVRREDFGTLRGTVLGLNEPLTIRLPDEETPRVFSPPALDAQQSPSGKLATSGAISLAELDKRIVAFLQQKLPTSDIKVRRRPPENSAAPTRIFEVRRLKRDAADRIINSHRYWEILLVTITFPNGDPAASPQWVIDGKYAAGLERPADTAFYPMQTPSPYAALFNGYAESLIASLSDFLARPGVP